MLELAKEITIQEKEQARAQLVQLKHLKGDSIFISDPEGQTIEILTTNDKTRVVFTKETTGKCIAIEERENGTKVYHISKDSTGLPSSHEIRQDLTEIVYFYNCQGNLQHFVELKSNGDRVSTLINKDGSLYSIQQKQIGGIVFQGWTRIADEPKDGMVWLHTNGEITTHGSKEIISELCKKFAKFLDGVVETK